MPREKKAQGDLLTHLSAVGPLPRTMAVLNLQFKASLAALPHRRFHERLTAPSPERRRTCRSATMYLVKDLMFVVLLLGLGIVGLTLYAKNAKFGSNRLFRLLQRRGLQFERRPSSANSSRLATFPVCAERIGPAAMPLSSATEVQSSTKTGTAQQGGSLGSQIAQTEGPTI
jgi:hypothetical protein